MNDKSDPSGTVLSAIEELSKAAERLGRDDLPLMGKMHEWCESLAAETGPDTSQSDPRLHESARTLAKDLETLILGDSDSPDDLLASLIARLYELSPGAPVSSEDVRQVPQREDDLEVAAKLDAVFADSEEDPVSTQSSTAESASDDSQNASDSQAEPPSQPAYVSEPLTIAPDEVEFLAGFLEEAIEHIESVETGLLDIENNPEDAERVAALFRSFHTIKGAAGFLGLRDVAALTHEAEALLDQVRKGTRTLDAGLIDLVFNVVDVLKAQISAISNHLSSSATGEIAQPPVEAMIAGLRDMVAGRVEPTGSEGAASTTQNRVGENLVEQGVVAQEAVDFAVSEQKRQPGGKKVGEHLIDMKVATPKQVSRALRPQDKTPGVPKKGSGIAGSEQSIRIDTRKLDALVDMVGELVIAQTQISSNPGIASDAKLARDVMRVTKIVRDVQGVAMSMRMVPIGPTFQKMARLVRDVSRTVGKTVELTITGEETELDKNVIQQIGDPLVHMVRNAADHGVELPEERLAKGKSAAGHVHLGACHRGGNIVIEISDDGNGLDPAVLKAKAIERGVVQANDSLTDEQAYQLVFAPGFSLAKKVTSISGRGVGMDVVRRNVEQLRGKVGITSQLGKGTTFSMQLPLTLAIIDGMVVRAGSERFIIQTITVEQALRPLKEQITTVQHKGAVLNVRGRLIPLVQLGALFGMGKPVNPWEAMVVIAQHAGGELGLVVDELLGQQQVVIKSLGDRFAALRGISGAAILGDGRIGLILEVSGLHAAHNSSRAGANMIAQPLASQATEERSGNVLDNNGHDTKAADATAAVCV